MAGAQHADVIFGNARLPTLEPWKPSTEFVAVKGGKIVGVGDAGEAPQFRGSATREIDCQGMALLPGFIDPHCHLFALASSLRGVDCRPDRVGSIPDIVEAIREAANGTAEAQWVRAFGYDDFYLAERRHPTRWDLDAATPHHPVRLDHRTGHACVLNSRALQMLDISRETPDPADGVIERDEDTGEPTGVLYEMADYVRSMIGTSRSEDDFLEGIRGANRLLLSKGITAVQDASPGNDLRRWQTFHRLSTQGHLTPAVNMMVGASLLDSFVDAGLSPGSEDGALRLGAVKLMLTLTTGSLSPPQDELQEAVLRAHKMGFQIAIHAVEEEAVEAAVEAIIHAQKAFPNESTRHRIEHCSECPPRLVEELRKVRAVVVTQPAFIHHYGEKYRSLIYDAYVPNLYPVASLVGAGIIVAAGSDAPVTYPDPLMSIFASVTRRTKGGDILSPSQRVTVQTAIKMHTINAAYACFDEGNRGSIAVGKQANLVLLDEDITATEPEAIRDARVVMTVVAGDVVWQG